MPADRWRIALGRVDHARAALRLEFRIGLLEEHQQLLGHCSNVLRVNECKRELHCALADCHVGVFEALEDSAAVALNCRYVHVDSAQQRVKCNVANVLVIIEQEAAENVDGQYAKSTFRLDVHDGQHRLVEDRVANVLARLCVRRNLRKNVVHRFRSIGIVVSKNAQQPKNLHLQERVRHTADVMLGRVAGQDQILQDTDEIWDDLKVKKMF